ncbi:MAG: CBS domain-containing protein [Isosphaeraceae bacterium]
MKARELMTQPVVSVRTDASLAEVAKTMVQCRVGCVPVVDEESQLRGMITQTDFAANEHGVPFSTEAVLHMFSHPLSGQEIDKVREDARKVKAKQIMITEVITADEETPVEEIARVMLRYDVDHIPVVREGMPIGLVSRHDFLRMIAGVPKSERRC